MRCCLRMAAVLHTIILSKGMTADNMNPGWDTEDAIEHAGTAEWGYSCCNIPEITTTMRHGAVFFSNNRNLSFGRLIVSGLTVEMVIDSIILKNPNVFSHSMKESLRTIFQRMNMHGLQSVVV